MERPIHEIANEVEKDFKLSENYRKKFYAAMPYLDAMKTMNKITDSYGADSGRMIVAYFLGNVTTWRGEKARTIKAELKKMLN